VFFVKSYEIIDKVIRVTDGFDGIVFEDLTGIDMPAL
jgi:hypothetical protein